MVADELLESDGLPPGDIFDIGGNSRGNAHPVGPKQIDQRVGIEM